MFWATCTPLSCLGWWTSQTAQLNATVVIVFYEFSVHATKLIKIGHVKKQSFQNKQSKTLHQMVLVLIFWNHWKKHQSWNIFLSDHPQPRSSFWWMLQPHLHCQGSNLRIPPSIQPNLQPKVIDPPTMGNSEIGKLEKWEFVECVLPKNDIPKRGTCNVF